MAVAPVRSDAVARVELLGLFRLLNRRKWVLIGFTALVVVVAAIIISQLTPLYRATTTLILDNRKIRLLGVPDILSGVGGDPPAIQTEIEVLRSTVLLGRVVERLNLEQDSEFGANPAGTTDGFFNDLRILFASWQQDAKSREAQALENGPRARALLMLSRALSISSSGRAAVILVSAESADRYKAKRIVDTLVSIYLEDQSQVRTDVAKRAADAINSRLAELKSSYEEAERTAATYREKSGLTTPRDSTAPPQGLTDLISQVSQDRALRADR
jgi:succinoglycan biosynthesis transport protein ExoP